MSDFGDTEPDDQFCDDGVPDPFQVAVRVHEHRQELAVLADESIADYHDLDEHSQQVAWAFADYIVADVVAHPGEWDTAAERAHGFLEALGRPPWSSLSVDEREVGNALIRLVLDWLVAEGSVR